MHWLGLPDPLHLPIDVFDGLLNDVDQLEAERAGVGLDHIRARDAAEAVKESKRNPPYFK